MPSGPASYRSRESHDPRRTLVQVNFCSQKLPEEITHTAVAIGKSTKETTQGHEDTANHNGDFATKPVGHVGTATLSGQIR